MPASRRSFLMRMSAGLAASPSLVTLVQAATTASETLTLKLRSRDASGEKAERRELSASQTAILICDMWDQHWCASATRRCGEIAKRMNPVVEKARAAGVTIVHSPSGTLEFYNDHPARKRALEIAIARPPVPIAGWCSIDKEYEGELPIDDSDGGCDCQPQCKQGSPWRRQHPAIEIPDSDFISDDGKQVYSYFAERGIKHVLYMGVHTNMCVLGRSFGIRQMRRLGFDAILVRDLTDTMYNPRMKPFVAHDEGTELVVAHIERHWCPSTTSRHLIEGLRG